MGNTASLLLVLEADFLLFPHCFFERAIYNFSDMRSGMLKHLRSLSFRASGGFWERIFFASVFGCEYSYPKHDAPKRALATRRPLGRFSVILPCQTNDNIKPNPKNSSWKHQFSRVILNTAIENVLGMRE
jgi:hypothetical protein